MDTTTIAVSSDHIAIVKSEYEDAARSLTPTSRSQLAHRLAEKVGIPYKIALQVVDVYCEQEGVACPDYLSREFNIGWLKVVSVALVVVAIGAALYARNMHIQQRSAVPGSVIAALFGGLAVLTWVKSLEAEASNFKEMAKKSSPEEAEA